MPEVGPSLGASRATVAECKRCKSVVGEFFNLFHKVSGSNSYYLPALLGSWSSRLKPTAGSPRTASSGTDLESCIIQPLACPKCGDTLGFHVVETPERKQEYLGRDIFKLSRITLKCEISPGDVQAVEPHVETLPTKPLSTNDNKSEGRGQSQSPLSHPTSTQTSESPPPSPSPSPSSSPSPEMANAEVDSRPPPLRQHDPPQLRLVHGHPPPQVESNRLPPPVQSPGERPTLPSIGLTQKSPLPTRSPAVMPVHRDEPPYAPPLPRESPAGGLANRSRETLPPILHSPSQAPHTNSYPADLDAIGRMQTQISQNTGALSAHARRLQDLQDVSDQQLNGVRREFHDLVHANMSRLGEMITALQRDMQAMQRQVSDLDDAMDNISRTVSMIQAQGPAVPAGSSSAVQAPALELMAQQLHTVSTKANEVDSLKITIEIMKGRIQRLEEGAGAPSTQPVPPHPQYAVTSYGSTPTPATHAGTPVHEQAESAQPQTFAAVNAPPKRVYSYAEDLPDVDQRSDSSKRLKLATMEPRNTYTVSQLHHSPHEQPLNPEDSHARPQLTQSHSQSQAHTTSFPSTHSLSHESSIAESTVRATHPTPTLPSQPSAQPAYYTQDAPSDESWRAVEQRPTRGRPRGGPGSRGGRGRKSLPAQLVHSTPEWEREDWQGVPESQLSPNGYYTHGARSARGTSVVRRGSGGAVATAVATPRGRPSAQYQQQQVVNLGMQGVTPGLGSPGSLNGTPIRMMSVGPGQDPYAHTKKTRTKPTRNADGVLIRKDGRPDMRSHSSAANLRKVHAKKESAAKERRGSGVWGDSASPPVQGTTPHQRDQQGTETPGLAGSPSENAKAGEQRDSADLSDPRAQKHNLIMKSIARGLQDWENIDPGKALRQDREEHVAHPERRVSHLEEQQHQQKHHQRGGKGGSRSEKDPENVRNVAVNGRDAGIKREHDERRVILDSQDGDEDMLTSERERDTAGEQDVDMRDRPGAEDMRSPSPRGGVEETQLEKERALNGPTRDGQGGDATVVAVADDMRD